MNKKLIVFVVIIFTTLPLSATLYRNNNGKWYLHDEKTDTYKELFTTKNTSDPRYRERKYPYQQKSDYTSLASDRSYIDQTNRDMGNNR